MSRPADSQHPASCHSSPPTPPLYSLLLPAVLKYFIAQREKEIESGAARKQYNKALNAGMTGAGAKPPVAGAGVRLLEGLAASGLRALRWAPLACLPSLLSLKLWFLSVLRQRS